MVGSRAVQSALSIPATFNPASWEGWFFQLMIAGTTAVIGASIGFFQWSALRDRARSRGRWSVACAFGVNISALVSLGSLTFIWPLLRLPGSAFIEFLHFFALGSVFGLITAIPLKRMLWPQSAKISQPEPARSAED